jgi:hypothetical protein
MFGTIKHIVDDEGTMREQQRAPVLSRINEIAFVSDTSTSSLSAQGDRAKVVPLLRGLDGGTHMWTARPQDCIAAICNRMKPVGEGTGDDTALDRAFNVATSIPYGLCGIYALKHRRSMEGKLWGASLVAVSAGASLFHASKAPFFHRKARAVCRKLDYWLITASTVGLLNAVNPKSMPKPVVAATLGMTMFEPFKISAANILAMEVEYARRAFTVPGNDTLRASFKRQLAAAAIGTACFFAEDAPLLTGDHSMEKTVPLVHAAWHCLSAYATAECNALLDNVERITCK